MIRIAAPLLVILALSGCTHAPADTLGWVETTREGRQIIAGARDEGPAPDGGRLVRAAVSAEAPLLRGDLLVDTLKTRELRDQVLAELLAEVCPTRTTLLAVHDTDRSSDSYRFRCGP